MIDLIEKQREDHKARLLFAKREGEEQGLERYQVQVVKQMLSHKYKLCEIVNTTGLSAERINHIARL